jgi:L-lactate dehydrogenase complex protein LldG
MPVTDEAGTGALLAEFQERSEALGVTVLRVPSVDDAARELGAWAASLGADRAVVAAAVSERAPDLPLLLAAAGFVVDAPSSPQTVRDAPVGVSMARMAVAETGSLLLAERSLPDRTVSMLTLALAIVCPTSALVASLDEAMEELQRLALAPGGGFATLVTGPSRTADIERVLTVGVQGPGKVMTLFVDAM